MKSVAKMMSVLAAVLVAASTSWGITLDFMRVTDNSSVDLSSQLSAELTAYGNSRAQLRIANLGPIDSPAYRLSAVAPAMYRRSIRWELPNIEDGWVAVKARLKNGHWVIGSPIRIRD